MHDNKQALAQAFFQLRHMQLQPEKLKIAEPSMITIKVCKNNSSSYSQFRDCPQRKFIFFLQQTEEQTPALSEGEQYTFQEQIAAVGTYHLLCLNYTKIKSTIEVIGKVEEPIIDLTEPIKLQSPPLQQQKLEAVQQQEKQQQAKQAPQNVVQKSNSKSDYAEYERILNDEEVHYDYMPNKYLRYFKEEFKLWRDFFEKQPEKVQKEYGSQPKDKVSSGSLSLSERESIKEQSVISHLRSQQEVSQFHQQELKTTKIMKKTNSQSCYVVDREVSKTHLSSNTKRRPLNTNTSSPHQNKQLFQADTLIDFAYNWSLQQECEEISLKKKNDSHLVNQWFTFLHNKFKISQFIYG